MASQPHGAPEVDRIATGFRIVQIVTEEYIHA